MSQSLGFAGISGENLRQGRSKSVQIIGLFCLSFLLFACSRGAEELNSDKAKVKIQIGRASKSDLAIRYDQPHSWWVPEQRNQKLANKAQSIFENKMNVGILAVGSENWGMVGLLSDVDIDCFVIGIEVPEDDNSAACFDDDGLLVSLPTVLEGPFAAGEAVEITVASGSSRVITVYGMRTLDGLCEGDANSISYAERSQLSPPTLIGSLTTDLSPGDNTVIVPAAATGFEPEVESCIGGPTNWDNGSICNDPTLSSAAMFTLGDGSFEAPWLICSGTQMNTIGTDSSKWADFYKLMGDIDLSSFTGTSYNIIGTVGTNFTGEFFGNAYTIDGFTRTNVALEQGLFGVASGAFIEDFSLTNVNLTIGGQGGAVLGDGSSTTISNVFVSGTVNNSGAGELGCFVGICSGCDLFDLDTTCTITTAGGNSVGGIVGNATGSDIDGVQFAGTINVASSNSVGGIAGVIGSGTTIFDAFVSGNVTGFDQTGGVVGSTGGGGSLSIDFCTVTGDVSGDDDVGGILGAAVSSGVPIDDVFVNGDITGTNSQVGGIVGITIAGTDISNAAYEDGTVQGATGVGGLVGNHSGSTDISFSYVKNASVTATSTQAGGLVGQNNVAGNSINESAAINVTVTASSGLAGGIAGSYSGAIADVYSTGSVSSDAPAGGIVGRFTLVTTVDTSYSTMTVGGTNATSSSSGGLGGLLLSGVMTGHFQDSWFGGTVSVNSSTNTENAMILGDCTGGTCSRTNVRINSTTATCTNAGAGDCLDDSTGSNTTAELQNSSTSPMYDNWDFVNIWTLEGGFPILQALDVAQ